ncbi:MAG: hypothetical protein BWX86_00953 [Verrucomicrobia bacterium ADurb.Bin122]|nr:MAG: hypothetical protein BWX86_00953 [Verrucomicrobia bacterium ADurb.Bin122]
MAATVFFEQTAIVHLDASGPRHQVIRVFDGAEALRVVELLVPVALHTVEL